MHKFSRWSDFMHHWRPLMQAQQRAMLVAHACDATYQKLIPNLLAKANSSALVVNLSAAILTKDGKTNTAQIHEVNAINMKHYLGQTHHALLYDASSEFNISVFSALCGCLSGGSLALLIIPEDEVNPWSQQSDQQLVDYHNLDTKPMHTGLSPSYFKRWWQDQWQRYAGVMVLDKAAQTSIPDITDEHLGQIVPSPNHTADATTTANTFCAKPEQTDFIAAVMSLNQQPMGVLCLSGARGRGKSTALAMACLALQQADQSFVVSIAASHSVVSLHQHLCQHLNPDGQDLSKPQTTLNAENFMALDYLLTHRQQTDRLLFIEEASTVPLALLRQILSTYNKVVLINTIDGYEGTGQGLRIKLPRILQSLQMPCRYLHFTKPLRWQPQDLLEDMIHKCFLPNALPDLLSNSSHNQLSKLSHAKQLPAAAKNVANMHTIQGQSLYQQPKLLADIFALLQQAHYQTTPQDLRLLLDHPQLNIHYWLDTKKQLLAVACTLLEGHLTTALGTAIAQGQRRIKGHLLPQILLQQGGIGPIASFGFRRIQRIAVTPYWQKQGLGSQLLTELQAYYQQDPQVDFIGASFAAEPDVVSFWLRNKYHPVWAGLRMDTATGLPSLQVIKALSHTAKAILLPLQQHWFFYHQYLGRHWHKENVNDVIKQTVLHQTQSIFRGYPQSWLSLLAKQVTEHHGNIYSIVPYLWQHLLNKNDLTRAEHTWMKAVLVQSSSHRQLVAQTRDLLRHSGESEGLDAFLRRREGFTQK